MNRRTRGDRRRGEHAPFVKGHALRGRLFVEVEPPNPSGLCMCGCGAPAPVATMSNTKLGHVAGLPLKFILGHALRAHNDAIRRYGITADDYTVEDRGYVTPCWIWKGRSHNQDGHATVTMQMRQLGAHRAMYEQEVGPIPDGLEVDHLCFQPPCVNPAHLEPVTRQENMRRSHARNPRSGVRTASRA